MKTFLFIAAAMMVAFYAGQAAACPLNKPLKAVQNDQTFVASTLKIGTYRPVTVTAPTIVQ